MSYLNICLGALKKSGENNRIRVSRQTQNSWFGFSFPALRCIGNEELYSVIFNLLH